MAATQERRLSEFPTAANILLTTLLFGSVVDTTSTSGYDSVKILASDLANAILGDFAYTQDLQTNNKTIFGAINELRVLSGSATPDNAIGTNNQLYIKYNASDYSVVGLYVKLNNAWREISTGGGGNTDYIECTQAQYDAWEQAGTLDPDTLYFITDGNIGNDIIDDSTTSASKVWSSDKTDREIQAVASDLSDLATIVSNIPKIRDLNYTFTLSPNQYVPPFTHYQEQNISADIGNKMVIGVFINGQTTTNPTTYTYNNGYLRVYGMASVTVNVKVLVI